MAPRKQSDRLTPLETEIMNALWEISPATAQTVRRLTQEKLARLRQTLKAKEARDGND